MREKARNLSPLVEDRCRMDADSWYSVHDIMARPFLASAVCLAVLPALGLCDCGGRTPLQTDAWDETEFGSSRSGASGQAGGVNVESGAGSSSPAEGGSRLIGPPAQGGSRLVGPPAQGGSRLVGPPAQGGSRLVGPPAQGGSRQFGGGGGEENGGGACPDSRLVSSRCRSPVDESQAGLCNGLDDDCDGVVDERCPCVQGDVQSCFFGHPGQRDVGACHDGTQKCTSAGSWGPCEGGMGPTPEICDGLDNDCNGCIDDLDDCRPIAQCPAPGDPRIPDAEPFGFYPLRGGDFFPEDARIRAWTWTVTGGPCDAFAGSRKSFDLLDSNSKNATLLPRLSGDYTIGLRVALDSGETLSCTWIVRVAGPGLRVEMCYPESTYQDLDLYLKQPGHATPWFVGGTPFSPADDQCDWHNCEAELRTQETSSPSRGRADWGYPATDLSSCVGGPQGDRWRQLGYCANPRLDIDNNNSSDQGSGLPENINIDNPNDGDTFRIMVENFTGLLAHPIVNVYCSGQRVATYGAYPDELTDFQGNSGTFSLGAMWRVADVTTRLDSQGRTTCEVRPLRPPNSRNGYVVTREDPSF